VQDLEILSSYGTGDIYLGGRSYGDRVMTAFFERDTESSEFVLLDRETREVRPLFKQRKALDGLKLQPLEPVTFLARDGLRLNGYLTRPIGATGKVPLVLVIHGGPYARDYWSFNSVHQWLASRGYAVLSLNYRGSTGYGKAFVTAADHQWGGRMHDDLIDAVDWAVGQGFADPARVGFFGASYGGYSALMAATKTPEVFACIVDLFGISNLQTFMATIPPYWQPWFNVWKNRVGNPDTEEGRVFLADRSPLNHLDRATKPILIAQGLNDVRVVAAESQLEGYVHVDSRAEAVIERWWPGPLTVILHSAGGGTLGVRIPNHEIALELLRASGPLMTTSANLHGDEPAMTAEEAGRVPGLAAVLDGGRAPGGTASTVVDLSGPEIHILREGAIPAAHVLGPPPPKAG